MSAHLAAMLWVTANVHRENKIELSYIIILTNY